MSELLGCVLGATAALGTTTAVAASPPIRRIRLDDRIAPYLRGRSRGTGRSTPTGPFSVGSRLLQPTVEALARRLEEIVGGTSSVRRRLEQAGCATSVEQFRIEQVTWAALGLAAGLMLAVAAAAHGSRKGPVAFLIVAMVQAIAGATLRDRRLTVAVVRREERIAAEFPTVAELLALAVTAGEGPLAALQRVCRQSSGALGAELARAVAEVGAGGSLIDALESMAARTSVPALSRFVDGMVVAVERGTPLADVLRAQAADVREESRRALLEAGGRKEIAMLVPVVFFVLPVTVVFAIFPGLFTLQLSAP